jgi:hypothetical protein
MKKLSSSILIFLFAIYLSAQDREVNSINAFRNELNSLIRLDEEQLETFRRLKYLVIRKEESLKAISKAENKGEEFRILLGVQSKSIQTIASHKMFIGRMINEKIVYNITGFQNANDAFFLSQELRKHNLASFFVTRYINGVRDYGYRFAPYQTYTNYTPPHHNYSIRMQQKQDLTTYLILSLN